MMHLSMRAQRTPAIAPIPGWRRRALQAEIRARAAAGSLVAAAAWLLGLVAHPSIAQAQLSAAPPVMPTDAAVASPVTAVGAVYIGTITDPVTGRQYDRYEEPEQVPVVRWEQQAATERRWIAEWTTETMKSTETRYVPVVTYQPQQHIANRWNPMAQPQVQWNYVPVTQYQAINQVVERPVTYQKYVQRDVPVLVPKPVQTTETRKRLVDRERPSPSGQAAAPTSGLPAIPDPARTAADAAAASRLLAQASPYRIYPLQGNYAPAGGGYGYPYSPYAALVTPRPAYSGGPIPSYAQSPMLATAPVPAPYQAAYPSYNATARDWFRWPAWTQRQGPWFQQNPYATPASNGYAPPSYYAPSTASIASVPSVLRPSTASVLPTYQAPANTTWGSAGSSFIRDPMQQGMAPSVLR